MRDPLGSPPTSRNPDTVFLFALCLMAGGAQLGARTEPGSVDALVPTWMAAAWGGLLIVGAMLVLAGVVWPNANGPFIELVGRAMFGPSALAYAVAIYAAANDFATAALAAAPFVGFSLACLVRAWQIIRRTQSNLHRLRHRNSDA